MTLAMAMTKTITVAMVILRTLTMLIAMIITEMVMAMVIEAGALIMGVCKQQRQWYSGSQMLFLRGFWFRNPTEII